MTENNRARFLKRDIMIRVARHLMGRDSKEKLDRIPFDLSDTEDSIRCCRHRDRAIIRDRVLASLGFGQSCMKDEYSRISEILDAGCQDRKESEQPLTVIHEACSSCVQSGYFVTNACRGCLARPCQVNCPVDAITFKDGKAFINDNCINCGKCKNLCPYTAIVKVSAPCEQACPVDAISRDKEGKIVVDNDKCILCGKCMKDCPFSAILERSHMKLFSDNLNNPMTALLAPSIAGQFPGTIGQIKQACLDLGFDKVMEVADGAGITAEREAEEWAEMMIEGKKFMTSSCCPSWIMAAEKYLPELIPFISTTDTPMQITADEARKTYPENKVVFIGPCLAKRNEADRDKRVDLVLSFEELAALFIGAGVDVMECGELKEEKNPCFEGRGFSFSGGVTEAVRKNIPEEVSGDLKPHLVDGLSAKQIKIMKTWVKRKAPGNFCEIMACEGGCANGPGTVVPREVALKAHLKQKV